MNNLKNLDKWALYDMADGKYIMGDLIDGDTIEYYACKVLRIDFENRIVETNDGYFSLGDEHK